MPIAEHLLLTAFSVRLDRLEAARAPRARGESTLSAWVRRTHVRREALQVERVGARLWRERRVDAWKATTLQVCASAGCSRAGAAPGREPAPRRSARVRSR